MDSFNDIGKTAEEIIKGAWLQGQQALDDIANSSWEELEEAAGRGLFDLVLGSKIEKFMRGAKPKKLDVDIPKAFTVDKRVMEQLSDTRMGRLAGKITPERLNDLVNSPTARRFFDSRSGNVNIIQEIDGKLIRIKIAGDKFKVISIGPIQERSINNLINNGGFVPIGATP